MTMTGPIDSDDTPTCGKGLAEHSQLPELLGRLTAAVADILSHHTTALDITDERSRAEHDAYVRLAEAHRRTAADLFATAREMAGYRTLPMGPHDPEAMMSPRAAQLFAEFVQEEEALAALLHERLERDRAMLAEMGGAPG